MFFVGDLDFVVLDLGFDVFGVCVVDEFGDFFGVFVVNVLFEGVGNFVCFI